MGVLDGKVAVITGSTRGLGLAMGRVFVQEGAVVVISSRSSEAVERAVGQLRSLNERVAGLACDVADYAQVQALADRAVSAFGRFDIWINNAALSAPYGPSMAIAPDRFAEALQTNILGTYYGSQVALRHFVPQRSGKLINLLGEGARRPVANQNAYASSKTWIRSFTLALASEYKASGVGVYAFNPGLVATDLILDVEAVAGYEQRVMPLDTVARMWANLPEVPARKAVWLASAATDGRTGLEVRTLGPTRFLKGLLREGVRRLLGRAAPPRRLKVRSVPSVLDSQ
jgi:glucose 1-dehydrogenase